MAGGTCMGPGVIHPGGPRLRMAGSMTTESDGTRMCHAGYTDGHGAGV